MSEDKPDTRRSETHPYELEVLPPRPGSASFHWAIRKGGKLLQRSDRSLPTEAKARSNGLAQIERLQHGFDER